MSEDEEKRYVKLDHNISVSAFGEEQEGFDFIMLHIDDEAFTLDKTTAKNIVERLKEVIPLMKNPEDIEDKALLP